MTASEHHAPGESGGAARTESPGLPAAADAADESRQRSRRDGWAISRGQLFMLLAIFLPAIASLLAPVFSGDIAYQIATGQLIFDSGAIIDTDPFTFTVLGEPWVNQQWGASVILGSGYELVGWGGLLILRAVLIGLTFGFVFAACRGLGASSIISSLVTLGMFVVAATNLALRSQTFGLLCFSAVVAVLVYRRTHPRLLWLIPIVMIVWGNTHGSFFVAWAAIGFAALEDVLARARVAALTIAVGLLSVVATLIHPWGLAMWEYVVELSTDSLIPLLVTEWQATTIKDPTGLFFFSSVGFALLVLLVGGRTISWLQLAWLATLALVGLMAVRGVAWWAIGAAPIVALMVCQLRWRGRRLGDEVLDEKRAIGYSAIGAVLAVFALAALPFWRPIHPLYGPEGVVRDAPRGVTEALLRDATSEDRLFADQTWGSWFELALPGVPVMVDSRVELFDREIWGDYLHVSSGRADWETILARWGVSLVATDAGNEQLRPFLDASAEWALLHEDDEGAVYRRVEGPG